MREEEKILELYWSLELERMQFSSETDVFAIFIQSVSKSLRIQEKVAVFGCVQFVS